MQRRHDRRREASATDGGQQQQGGGGGGGGPADLPAVGSAEHALLLAGALLEQAEGVQALQDADGGGGGGDGGGRAVPSGDGTSAEAAAASAAAAAADAAGEEEGGKEAKPGAEYGAGGLCGLDTAAAEAEAEEAGLCPICLDALPGIAIQPCSHRACLTCCSRLSAYCSVSAGRMPTQGPLCPLCRAPIEAFRPATAAATA